MAMKNLEVQHCDVLMFGWSVIAARGADVTTETWMAGGWQSWQSAVADTKYRVAVAQSGSGVVDWRQEPVPGRLHFAMGNS
jgi:hypothetical protein